MKIDTFTIIGGDCRSIATARQLCALGLNVHIFGFGPEIEFDSGVIRSESLKEALHGADFILLPLPYSSNGEFLNAPLYKDVITLRDIVALLEQNQIVFAGKVDKLFHATLEMHGIRYYDYAQREEFSVLNAIPTAEGAVEIALREMPITLNGASCLVLGFGRIAKVLTHILQGMGARVTAAARQHSDLAWIKAYGYEALHMTEIKNHVSRFQVIFNTIPYQVLDREVLSTVSKSCLIIDLASKPGGVDFESAQKLGLNVIWALSLPGEVMR